MLANARCPRTLAALLALLALGSPSCLQRPIESSLPGVDLRGVAPREFRAAWVATVANIDWPSKPGLSTEQQRAELRTILDRAAALRLNALVFQVRPSCDALYPSKLEPWSEWLTGQQGRAPSPLWDPLEYAVVGAHERGLELHAWFNPYRAKHSKAKSVPTTRHVARSLTAAVVRYGGSLWLNPADRRAREHSQRVILDVVQRYDIDGVHIDDYFYPYPEKGAAFPDHVSFRAYQQGGGRLDKASWRRAQVDGFIENLYAAIKKEKRWVKFGISPFGIARPGLPPGIEAGIDQYEELYADVRKWLAEGWCDYMAPQLYWPIAQKPQSYPVLLRWWTQQNPKNRHLWPGNFATRAASQAKGWTLGELADQIELTRKVDGATGNIHFSMKALMPTGGRLGDLLAKGPYEGPALVPASPWLDDEPPARPTATIRARGQGREMSWSRDRDVRWWTIYHGGRDGTWTLVDIVPGAATSYTIDVVGRGMKSLALAGVDRCGNESAAAVVSVH